MSPLRCYVSSLYTCTCNMWRNVWRKRQASEYNKQRECTPQVSRVPMRLCWWRANHRRRGLGLPLLVTVFSSSFNFLFPSVLLLNWALYAMFLTEVKLVTTPCTLSPLVSDGSYSVNWHERWIFQQHRSDDHFMLNPIGYLRMKQCATGVQLPNPNLHWAVAQDPLGSTKRKKERKC